MTPSLWEIARISPFEFHLLNLDHPIINKIILNEIDSGIDVYYDQRWNATEFFCRFLINNQEWIKNLTVLVLGTGIGMETLVIGKLCRKLYLNDLAPKALELCSWQLRKNNIHNYDLFPGYYEIIAFPPVDIVIGCYLIYNSATVRAMETFLKSCPNPVLLMNETLPAFIKFIRRTKRNVSYILNKSPNQCILFETMDI